MQISLIDDINQFKQLKNVWEKIYSADPHAQIFLSWSWLHGWFEVTTNNWLILACRIDSNSPYVAFFPLAINQIDKYGISIYSLLQMGSRPAADYTGFVCLPEYEEEAIQNFANYIQQNLKWDIFKMTEVFDPRLDMFLNCFSQEQFTIHKHQSSSCPHIHLPNTWESYLQDCIGSESRQNLCGVLTKVEEQSDLCFVANTDKNIESQIEALLSLWQMQCGQNKEEELKIFRHIFHRCHESNNLSLTILWDTKTNTAIAGTGIFVDRYKSICYGYTAGYNPEFSHLSPSRVMMAYTIKQAIEEKFKIYDFLRGNESSTFAFFGAKKHFNTDVEISRHNLRANTIKRIKSMKALLKSQA